MKSKAEEIIPDHNEGVQTNTESSVTFDTEAEAKSFFEEVKQRLLSVHQWHDYAGKGTASFSLTDAQVADAIRQPGPGDYLKIDIPGPGTQTGDGYDWVRIEAVEETDEGAVQCLIMRVRPASSPQNSNPDVAHFFSDAATSNFMAKREGTTVTAAVYGRNEKPNIAAEKLVDKARNAAVATGAVGGFSKLQWKSLVNGFVKK